jgi:hypothetical protein
MAPPPCTADSTPYPSVRMVNSTPTLARYVAAHLNRIGEGDFFALLAYITMIDAHQGLFQTMRQGVRDTRRVATCLEFGPRDRRALRVPLGADVAAGSSTSQAAFLAALRS